MKINDDHFEDYLSNFDDCSLHPKLSESYDCLPDTPTNLILYGPQGIGKYTQSLAIIRKYSPSKIHFISSFIKRNHTLFRIFQIHNVS